MKTLALLSTFYRFNYNGCDCYENEINDIIGILGKNIGR